jgi:hypothetical protein
MGLLDTDTTFGKILIYIIYLSIFSSLSFILNKLTNNLNNEKMKYLILLFLFICCVVFLSIYDPYNVISGYLLSNIIIFVLFGSFLISSIVYSFAEISKTQPSPLPEMFRKIGMFIFGSGISSLFIYWIIYNINSLSSSSNIGSSIVNLLIIFTILTLTYKALSVNKFIEKNPILKLITNVIFYIPCLFSNIIYFMVDKFNSIPQKDASNSNVQFNKDLFKTNISEIVLLLSLIIIFIVYYLLFPYIEKKILLQGGKQLVNKPVYLDEYHSLSDYETLNNGNGPNYKFGLSFWFYIDSNPSSTNSSYSKYVSILNYGNKPNFLYKAINNEFLIVVDQKNLTKELIKNSNLEIDENGYVIVYKSNDVLLQKWNNIIINYNGGTLDIFYNGTLVKSANNIVPYITIDTLSIGKDNGINGAVCNVNYFKNNLSYAQIYYLYNLTKLLTPPIISTYDKTIISTYDKTSNYTYNKNIKPTYNKTINAIK